MSRNTMNLQRERNEIPRPRPGKRVWNGALGFYALPSPKDISRAGERPRGRSVEINSDTSGPLFVIRDRTTGVDLWRVRAASLGEAAKEAARLAKQQGGSLDDVRVIPVAG